MAVVNMHAWVEFGLFGSFNNDVARFTYALLLLNISHISVFPRCSFKEIITRHPFRAHSSQFTLFKGRSLSK